MGDSLNKKLQEGKISYGALIWSEYPGVIDLLGFTNYDYFITDMMFGSIDWTGAANLCRAAGNWGITPLIRLQSNPWLGGFDARIVSDVARAVSIGYAGVMISVRNAEETETYVKAVSDWHIVPMTASTEFTALKKKMMESRVGMIPLLESKESLDDLEKFFSIEGLKVVGIAMTDLARVLGYTPAEIWSKDKSEVWDVVGNAVKLGKKKGVAVYANTSYTTDRPDLQVLIERAKRLQKMGVSMVMFQSTEYLLQLALQMIQSGVTK